VPWRAVARLNLFLLNWDLFKQSPSLEIKKGAEWGMSSGPGSVRCFLMANVLLSSGSVNGIDTVGIWLSTATWPHSRQDLGEFENLGMRKIRFKSYGSLSFANHQNSGNPPVFLPTTCGHNILARANLRFLPPLIAVGDRDMSSLPEC